MPTKKPNLMYQLDFEYQPVPTKASEALFTITLEEKNIKAITCKQQLSYQR